jgi:hypothetical protein
MPALAAGSRLGAYEVVGLLGAGGMGEVYRAQDTKLGRAVALKILPDAWAGDLDRLTRFKREAKALAALFVVGVKTRPNIELSSPIEVRRTFADGGPATPRNFDITPDGRFLAVPFLGIQSAAGSTPQFQVVLNWIEELKQRVRITH